MKLNWNETGGPRFSERTRHRKWLRSQAMSLLSFFQSAVNPAGGFFQLDGTGQALPGDVRYLHETARMVHSYAIGDMLGQPGAQQVMDHGMEFLWRGHRDSTNGGYFSSVNDASPVDATKQAYGHAFVLLAASSAKVAGHADADRLLADVTAVLQEKFWDAEVGATREEFAANWDNISDYRGQNSNMHLCEALMAAFEATGDQAYLDMAESIAALIIKRHAGAVDWRVAEHFDTHWQVDRTYEGDPMFRPRGTTPGHALEWSRLLIQCWELGGRRHDWMRPAAKALFQRAVGTAWDRTAGGLFYTLDWEDQPDQQDKFWWPCCEGIAAAAVLASTDDDPVYEEWYRRIWGYADRHFIDHPTGGWWPDVAKGSDSDARVFVGKPDIYHALQACLIPLLPPGGSVTAGLSLR